VSRREQRSKSVRAHRQPGEATSSSTNRCESVCLFGLDEAGYGPVLGPLVLVTAGVRMAGSAPLRQLNQRLRNAVPPESRLKITDSKAIYRGSRDFERLELNGLALWCVFLGLDDVPNTLKKLWHYCTGQSSHTLALFPWHRPTLRVPRTAPRSQVESAVEKLRESWRSAGIAPVVARARVVFPPELNEACKALSSKSKALLRWASELLCAVEPLSKRSTVIVLDQQGGRKDYSALLDAILPPGEFQLVRQTKTRSGVALYNDRLRLVVEPKADAKHFIVSACSIMAKYLRELFMHQWNGYWSKKANIPPTSGYPNDAKRFLEQLALLSEQKGELRWEVDAAMELYFRYR